MKKWVTLVMLCLTWIIFFKNGETLRVKEILGGQWASPSLLVYIDMDGKKTYISWSEILKVVEEK